MAVAGIDLGSTGIKLLVTDESGAELAGAQVPTPWRPGPGGTAELDAGELLACVRELLNRTTEKLNTENPNPGRPDARRPDAGRPDARRPDAGRPNPGRPDAGRLDAIAIAGMGETGMLIDDRGAAVARAFAWFDPRGAEQAAAFPPVIRDEFAGRTGLPLGAQVSVAKLAHLRDHGLDLAGLRWLNLPEFVAAALGGRTAVEHSLTSRTGLIDQDTGRPWPAMLHALGVTEDFLPPAADAGSSWGETPDGALITVAGHDHLVAAEANGGLPPDHYHVSMGTAEVLLRVIDAPLGFEARRRLAAVLINEVRHVVPGKHVLVAGVKTGLLLRRALQSAGISDRAGRDALDAAVMALPYEGALPPGAIEVAGARNDDGVLQLTLRGDGAGPAEVFGAVLRHSNDEIDALIRAMDRELPAAISATLTGGWAGMASVRRARSRVLPVLSVSDREQETAYGATRVAARLLSSVPPRMIGTPR